MSTPLYREIKGHETSFSNRVKRFSQSRCSFARFSTIYEDVGSVEKPLSLLSDPEKFQTGSVETEQSIVEPNTEHQPRSLPKIIIGPWKGDGLSENSLFRCYHKFNKIQLEETVKELARYFAEASKLVIPEKLAKSRMNKYCSWLEPLRSALPVEFMGYIELSLEKASHLEKALPLVLTHTHLSVRTLHCDPETGCLTYIEEPDRLKSEHLGLMFFTLIDITHIESGSDLRPICPGVDFTELFKNTFLEESGFRGAHEDLEQIRILATLIRWGYSIDGPTKQRVPIKDEYQYKILMRALNINIFSPEVGSACIERSEVRFNEGVNRV